MDFLKIIDGWLVEADPFSPHFVSVVVHVARVLLQ